MNIIQTILDEFYKLRDKKKQEFSRVLGFGEYFQDRFEKANYLGFGEGSSIYDSSLVLGDVKVGKNVWIGPFVILDGSGGLLEIGEGCNISAGVHIYTHDTKDRALFGKELKKGPVSIGDHTYVGPNSVITCGRSVGSHAVVGALSLVLTDIPSGTKAYGSPAVVVGTSQEGIK